MTIGLTEEQAALAASVAQWASGRAFPEVVRAAEDAGHETLLSPWDALAGLGLLGIAVPESFGGAGGTRVDLACALEAAAEGLVPGPLLSTATCASLLAEHPDTAVAKRLLPGLCDGSIRVGLAPTCAPLSFDPDAGTLAGRVPVVADASGATHLFVGVESDAGETWLVLPADASGVTVHPAAGAPDLSRTVGSVRLDGVTVDSDHRMEAPQASSATS